MAKLLFLQNLEYELLGPMYISSMLKSHGHECRLALGKSLSDFSGVIEEYCPDMVGFSVMSGSHLWAIEVAGAIRQRYGIPTVFGGPHATFFPELIEEPNVDILIRGEGEDAMLDVLNCIDAKRSLERENIPNTSIKTKDGIIIHNPLRNLRDDLDSCPFPDRHLYDALDGRIDRTVRSVISSRGCPFSCTFCFNDSARQMYDGKGRYVRIRSIDRVIEECLELKRETNAKVIFFMDDVFGINKKWLYEFLPIFKREVGLEFVCLVRADMIASDEEYALRLAEGGCSTAYFGIESGSERLRNVLLKKKVADMEISKAADYLHRAGIKFRTFNILGLPGETMEEAFSTVTLNIAIKADYPWCSIFLPLPKTKLTEYAVEHGYLDKEYLHSLPKSFFLSSALKSPHNDELVNLQRFFQTVVLWPRTLSLARLLIKMKPNVLFKMWFGLIYFYVHIKSEKRSFWSTFKFAMRNFKHVIGK